MQNLCNEKMKLNKFVDVKLPKNKVLFLRCQGLKVPNGSHEIVTADFTSRNIEAVASSVRTVHDSYNAYLNETQMPLDTDIDSSSEVSDEKPDTE